MINRLGRCHQAILLMLLNIYEPNLTQFLNGKNNIIVFLGQYWVLPNNPFLFFILHSGILDTVVHSLLN